MKNIKEYNKRDFDIKLALTVCDGCDSITDRFLVSACPSKEYLLLSGLKK